MNWKLIMIFFVMITIPGFLLAVSDPISFLFGVLSGGANTAVLGYLFGKADSD